ncbi:AEC family transporter [Propionivibrio dicarboxylicus]|uniref:Transporter n=1 Tax=Propionivibrio dicarboxylicus TaxID=83767 RepID=A0A1G8KE61_9RHOO|nr:AEC family transporter [Propionivibrio dicarboxylicus]SDI41703.1 hypothetical protein SAMN05660652_03400 [Propionivibrio dicarboxylicus]
MLVVLSFIFLKIMVPLFVLIGIGFVAQKAMKMDARTFARMTVYVLVPAVMFIKMYSAKVDLHFFATIILFVTVIQILMFIIGEISARMLGYSRSKRKAFSNALTFFNSGNYGLPLADLIFKSSPIAASVQVFIMMLQNTTGNTVGVLQASSANSSYRKALRHVFTMPSFYVLLLIIPINYFGISIPEPVLVPLKYLADGFIALALITLGVQLADIKCSYKINDVLLPCFIRLVVSPILGFLLTLLLGIKGELAQALIIGVSTPSAINTAILAREFNNEPDYAAKIVFYSTLLSGLSMSFVIYCLQFM